MKLLKLVAAIAVVAMLLPSCALVKSPLSATVYTDVKAPVAVTGNAVSNKVGTSKAQSYLGVVAVGDASIDAAAKQGGITKIHHVDEHATNVLGVFARYEVIVYGE